VCDVLLLVGGCAGWGLLNADLLKLGGQGSLLNLLHVNLEKKKGSTHVWFLIKTV
jgi:hypothetical protein